MIRHKNGISRGQIAIDKFLFACQKGNDVIIEHLFKSGDVNANAISEEGKTPLTLAIIQNNITAVKILLKYGANLNRTSHVHYHRDHGSSSICSFDESPLNTAARLKFADICKLLIKNGADVNIQSECRPPQGVDTIKDRTALHFAAESGDISTVVELIGHGADVNIADKQSEIPLHLACRCKARLCENQVVVIHELLKHKAVVNKANKSAQVPLYLASFYGCEAKARILIENGADVNYSRCQDTISHSLYVTALHVAASKNRIHLAKLLIENGAKLNTTNALNYSPLQMNLNTHGKSSIATLLVLHGTDLNVIDINGFTLMASLIHNMRLDCEILAQLLVFAGYNLNRDLWILPQYKQTTWLSLRENSDHDSNEEGIQKVPEIAIPQGRVERLCDWLHERQSNATSLLEICRISIRLYLSQQVTMGSSITPRIRKLPLPRSVIDYLLLKDVYASNWVEHFQSL